MSTQGSLQEGLKAIKNQKILLVVGLIVLVLLSSFVFKPDEKTEDKEKKEDVVKKEKVDFNVALDTIEKPVQNIFNKEKETKIVDNNPWKKEEKEKETKLSTSIEKLEKRGTTPDPYKNDNMWKMDPTPSKNNLGLEKALTEEEKILQKIEQRKKLREQMRAENQKNASRDPVSSSEKIRIKAYVYRNQNVLPDFQVNLTLITPFIYNGKKYESGFSLVGNVIKVERNKVFIEVNSIGDDEDRIKLKAYDPKGKHEGLYYPQAGALEQELKFEIERQGLQEAARESQSGLVRAVSTVLTSNKRKKFTFIPLENDKEMVLKNY
ncbi:conjugative transposon protein TraM [Aquimarina mytili]|uniref:Conjugative transposon protein TraM n=1 Tax=Aquimarina mytili TaxID=874423 RepID=A0A937A244_9FLAO|nr:conjugative transposon protein TraM [Aquimarina mytili]MBL0686070.1 conjugative transposon protein TraM [Aquimarina mytili]